MESNLRAGVASLQSTIPEEENKASESRTPVYSSYKAYIDSYVSERPEYKWLQLFLNKPGAQPSETETTILDSISGTFTDQSFISDITGLSDALDSRSPEVDTRLIIVSYRQTWVVDRQVVDLLGMRFDINPNFFRRHFYYYFSYVEALADKTIKDTIEKEVCFLPSEADPRVFELSLTRSYHKVSTIIHKDPLSNQTTALILQRENPHADLKSIPLERELSSIRRYPASQNTETIKCIRSRYMAALRNLLVDQVKVGDQDPVCFLIPYAQILLREYYGRFRRNYDYDLTDNYIDRRTGDLIDRRGKRENAKPDPKDQLFQIQFELASLRTLDREISRICQLLPRSQSRPQFEDLSTDIASLKLGYQNSITNYLEFKQDTLIEEQLKEAKESKEVAVSVGTLSKLAFIFIRLTFTTSVFGMNLSEFGQGTTTLGTFFITAAVISTLTLIPIAKSLVFGITMTKFRRLLQNLRQAILLARYSPSHAFWYAVLAIVCGEPILVPLCASHLRVSLGLPNPRRIDAVLTKGEAHQKLEELWQFKFWESKIQSINDFLDEPDWK